MDSYGHALAKKLSERLGETRSRLVEIVVSGQAVYGHEFYRELVGKIAAIDSMLNEFIPDAIAEIDAAK